MNAIKTLIEHAQETYPHFESERGQADIKAAKKELFEILNALNAAILHLENPLMPCPESELIYIRKMAENDMLNPDFGEF